MFAFDNVTRFEGALLPLVDRDARDVGVVVVKATFDVGPEGALALAATQEPVAQEDIYEGEPGASPVLYESDMAPVKPGTDVVLIGSARSPGARPVQRLDVTVKVGSVQKTVRVFGDRVWKMPLPFGEPNPSRAEPFTQMPLTYARAFGGADPAHPSAAWEERNPVGTGFHARKKTVSGSALPNLEDPKHPIRSWRQRPQPWSFGFTGKGWLPRRKLGGTYDDRWFEEEMPRLPRDFDERFFQGAGSGQVALPPLAGGETFEATGVRHEGPLRFTLPSLLIGVGAVGRRTRERVLARLDTLVVWSDAMRVQLVWRKMIPAGRKHSDLASVSVFELAPSTRPLWDALVTSR